MDGVTELASRIKAMEMSPYSPMIGTITSLPELEIQLGDRIQLGADKITAVFDIYETRQHDGYVEYVNLNKQIVLLPCMSQSGNVTRFIAIGVVV